MSLSCFVLFIGKLNVFVLNDDQLLVSYSIRDELTKNDLMSLNKTKTIFLNTYFCQQIR